MKSQDIDCLPVDSPDSLLGHRPPTLIFTSRGSGKGYQTKSDTFRANRATNDASKRSSFGSVDIPSKIGASGHRKQFTVMNGNSNTGVTSIDKGMDTFSTMPSNSEVDFSLENRVLPLPTQSDANTTADKRKSWTVSKTSSSLTRRYSYDVNPAVQTKPPPLIPAPKSFLYRQSSLSSFKRNDEFQFPPSHHDPTISPPTNISQDVLLGAVQPSSPPQLPPTPPLTVDYNNTEVDDAHVHDSQKQESSFLELASCTHTSQHSQTSPIITSGSTLPSPSLPSYPPSSHTSPSSFPPPHFRFPSPPRSPPPPSPILLEEPSTSKTSTPITASTSLSPHSDDGRPRKGSLSPSEAMGYLDEAIADHRLSSSSQCDGLDHPDSSPALSAEHFPESFTSNASKAAELEDSPKETEAKICVTHSANATSLQHPEMTPTNPQIVTSHSRNTETLEKVKSFEETVGNISHHPEHDVRVSSPDRSGTDEPQLPDKPPEQKTRKTSISPKKVVEVLKLQPDIKTIRQQIKPGIVGELASLFQHMGDEYDTSSPSGLTYLTTDQTVRNRESCHENKQQLIQTATSDRFHSLNGAVSNGKENEDINIVITNCSRSQSPSDNEEQIQSRSSMEIVEQIQSKSSMEIVEQSQLKSIVDTVEQTQTKSVVDSASVEDARIKPALDYLSASKEIFKRVTESRSQCEANIAKTETSVDRHEAHDFAMVDITFPSLLASSTPTKIVKKNTLDIENSNNDSYTYRIRPEPLETDMKFGENIADLNTAKDETASTVTKSTNSDNQDCSNLTIVKSLEGAVQKPDHATPADGLVYVYGDVNGFSEDNKERPSSHGLHSAIINEPSSTVVKEVSINHDQSVSKLELRANIKQDGEACVTHSQSQVGEGGTHGSQDDELTPRINNCQWNVAAVINSPRPRPLSHVTSSSEHLLTTESTESTNNFMNSNNSQPFTCVKNYNTLDETPVAKTGSENQIQTNKGSLRSKFSCSTQTVSNSQSNSDDREWGSDNITSFTSQQSRMIVTTSSNHDGVMTDGDMNLDLSPASRHDHSYRSEVNDDVKHITTNSDVYSTSRKNGDSADNKISYGDHGMQVKATRSSSFTVDLTPTGNQVEDYSHKQTVDASFQPPAYSDYTILAGSVQDGFRSTDDADLNSQRIADQVSDEDLFVKVPEPVIKSQKNNLTLDAVEINGTKQLNTDSSVTQHSDNFLSILDDITIQTDITSGFLGSSRRNGKYASEKYEHNDNVSHLVDIYENRLQEHSSQKAMKADDKHMLNESSPTYDSSGPTFNEPATETMERDVVQFDHSLPASTEITSVTSFLPMRDHADLNEEIQKQHDVLSPRLNEHAEYEKVLHRDNESIRSHSSSLSSTSGSQTGTRSGTSKETVFNRDFFSRSQIIPGKSHQVTLQEDALNEATVHHQSHADIFQNTQNLGKTVDNLNKHENISHSEWITPVEMPRLIPWSEYESRAQIPLNSISTGSRMDSVDTSSHRSSISSTGVEDNEQNKAIDTAVTRDVFSKQQVTSNTVERRLTRKESLITASNVLRSIPWGEYEEKLNVDAEPVEPIELVKSSSNLLLQQEPRKVTGSRLSSQGSTDSADGSFAKTGNEIYEEKRQEYDITYSTDMHETGYIVRSNDYTGHANDSNNNILPISVTPESSSVTQFVAALPRVVSNEEDETPKQKQDEIHMSKNKFQALKNVFEKQDFENHPKPAAGFLAKRDSFKFGASRRQPTATVSRAENDKNGGMSIEVGANVTSQHETGVHVSRDTDHRGVDVDVQWDKKATEIDTTERRDSQCTDTYSQATDGELVDTPGTRETIKKSQQTSLAYDVQTGELLRHSLSRNSSVRSSSSSHSVNTAERFSSHIQPVSEHFPTDTEAIGKPHTRSWTTTVNGFDLDKNVELPHVSESSSLTNTFRENDRLEIPTDSSENTSSEPDKQTDLIDAFLKSTVGFKHLGLNQTPLSEIQEVRKPAGHTGLDKSGLRGGSRKGSFGQTEEYNSDSHHDDGTISFQNGIGSVNVRSDPYPKATFGYSEPSSFDSTNSERQHSDNMTAVVGETSSFSIHKKITTREESFGVQSETSTAGESPRDNTSTRHSQPVTPDMYLIADKKGDYYALQEVDDEADGGSVVTDNVNLHLVEMSRTDGHSRAIYDPSATNNHHYPQDGDITDVYIDSSAVDNDKARELISAYLDSQELNRQHNNTANDVHTYQDHSTTQQHYSRTNYSEDVAHRHANVSDGNTGRSHAVYNSGAPETSGFVSSTNNGSIIVQQNGYSSAAGSAIHSNYADSRSYINSSTHQHGDISNNFTENSYMSNSSHFGQLNASTGDRDSFTSSYNLTRLTTPHVQGSSPAVVDTAFGTHIPINQSSDSASHTFSQSGVTPFQTTPLTITTTTQAVVGEQVGMRINYPSNGASDAFISSSDEETNQKRYIVKNVQQKSSLKKSSKYDPRSFSDSNSDVFTPGGTVATQYSTIGTSRDILQSHDFDARHTRSFNGSDSFSPRSATDEPAYRVYQSPTVSHSLPRSSNDHNSSYTQENSYISSRQDENNLYKVRNLSTSVPDGLQYTGEQRGRSGNRSPSYADRQNAFRGVRKQHHSPERIFKNAKLSLRKDDYDNDYYSDEEDGNTLYRTVTKVYLNENKPRSRSQSPDTRYKVSSVQSSYEKKQYLDETDSGYQEQHRRYIVVGTSDNSENRHGVSAHSSPKLDRKLSKSFEEATITRTELVQPSRLNNIPPSTKTHKTVIQLESAENTTKDRDSSHDIDSQYMIKRAKSVDDIHRESRSTLTASSQDRDMYRTGQLRSHSNSEDEELDRQQTSVYSTTPRLVKTFQQEDGEKLYVINSTVPRGRDGDLNHPAGWYKSTIDINQNRPEKAQSVSDLLSRSLHEDRFDSNNYRTEKSVYFVREAAPQTSTTRTFRGNHSAEFAYPDSGTGTEVTSSDGENEVRQKFERVERIYEVRSQPDLPEHFQSMEDLSNDLRVLRGNILIKNRLNDTEHGVDGFDENVNLFDNSFHLGKDNPLFSSDPDILASLQREEQALASHVHQDITFETVDKIAHEYRQEKQVQRKEPAPRKKQNLSQLLLSKLANVDSKDIRQTIDVEHHNEEIYGDIDFIHADGERKTSSNTRNFDSVNEKVELTLTQGKAFVIIKVIAERIVPTDYEFNVWRKSQAIVTRQIEIDLLANEQRRRLYKHVMASAGTSGSLEDATRSHYYDSEVLSAQERQLSSMETLKLFSQILDVTEGQGDKDYTETHTRQEMGQLPAAGMDLLY